jgi:hypothetical protein
MMGTVLKQGSNTLKATAKELLPSDLYQQLQRHFTSRRLEYIANVLTPGELRVLGSLYDAFIIARIKRMSDARLKKFDQLTPIDEQQQKFYVCVQAEWLKNEQYLLGTVLKRCPTQKELFLDFMNNHHGLRFRAYFAMKYPERMRKNNCKR